MTKISTAELNKSQNPIALKQRNTKENPIQGGLEAHLLENLQVWQKQLRKKNPVKLAIRTATISGHFPFALLRS